MKEPIRNRVAYLKINCGLSMKEIAAELGLNGKTAEYHWAMAQRVIRRLPLSYAASPSIPKVRKATCGIRS